MASDMNRRQFLLGVLGAAAAGVVSGCAKKAASQVAPAAGGGAGPPPEVGPANLVIASGEGKGAAAITRAAVEGAGGIAKFVKKDARVVIKPNMAWQRRPEQAASTNPDLVTELARMCREAGAKEVTVLDHVIDRPARLVLEVNGLAKAARDGGAKLVAAELGDSPRLYREIEIPRGTVLTAEQVVSQVLDADVFINVPIAKQHSGSVLTLSMKNLMGIIFNRQGWHQLGLHTCIAEFATAVRPHLIVVDAMRILTSGGPKGPGTTKDVGQVIVGTDPVAADAYAATLFGLQPDQVPHIAQAAKLGVGQMDLSKVAQEHVHA